MIIPVEKSWHEQKTLVIALRSTTVTFDYIGCNSHEGVGVAALEGFRFCL